MSVSTSSQKTFHYGPNLVGLYVAVMFFSFCSAIAYYLAAAENNTKAAIIFPLGLFMTLAAFVLAAYYSRACAPREIVFEADRVLIPAQRLSSRIASLKYVDLINVKLTKVFGEDALVIQHRDGKLKLPLAMLHKTDVHELHRELMNRRAPQAVQAGAAASAV